MQTFWQDLRYGARMLLKNPGFALIAIITLALGIGANAAIFSVVNAVLLRPLPFKEPERLMMIRETKLPQFPEFSVSPGNFLGWKRQNTVFERLVAYHGLSFNLIGTGDPEELRGLRVTDGFLAMLGVRPELGRDFLPEEDQFGRSNVVILSHGLWQRRFGGDPKIINQTITLSGQSYTVIGVMPATFSFGGSETELWRPMGFSSEEAQNHGGHYLSAIGQLNPGATLEQARSEMSAIAGRLAQEYPNANAGWNVKLMPLHEFIVRSIGRALLVLLGAVAFVLLIACANVANLLLARAAGRQKEVAIRAALGAGRARIVRQLLTESALLALAGGAAGLLLAKWGMNLLLTLAPQNLPRISGVSLDSRVLAFTAVVTLLTGVIFGLVPALQASKPNLGEMMKDAGARGSTEGGRRQYVRSSLVVLEVASALLLLVGAGLLIRSFWRLQQVDPGFNPNNALTVSVTLPPRKYSEENQQAAFFQQLLEKVRTLPGVQAAGVTVSMPLAGGFIYGFVIEGRPPLPPGAGQSTNYSAVSADYFKAMGIPLLRGRVFTEQDAKSTTSVAVISETMAKRMFPNEDPIGKRIHITNGPTVFREIVGIVGDVKQDGLDQDTTLQTYEPFTQQTYSSMTLVVRTASDPTNQTAAIRNQVLSIDKEQPIARISTLEQRVSASVAQQKFSMLLLGVFAAVALVLAVVGIYGVLSYAAAQRTHEIGIRMALGARAGDVLKMVIGQGMRLVLSGVALGLGAALGLTQLMKRLLFGVEAVDPMTYSFIAVLLTLVALFACWIPARRAAKVDPIVALRID
jgi:putative ABC transport system permease protein